MPMRSVCVFVVFLCVWASGPVLCKAAQEGSLPKDPAALFALAREKNGLESSDVRPWHIRGSYTFYDIKSNVGDKGVYEEWWVSAARYKRSFTGQKFTQTEYATGGRLLRTGSQDWPGADLMLLRSSLIEPLLYDSILKEFTLKRHTKSIGKYKLDCVFFTYPVRGDQIVYDESFPNACFDPTILALRVTSTGGQSETTYDLVSDFQGYFIPHQLRTFRAHKLEMDFTLDLAEVIPQIPEAFPDAPPDAQPVDLTSISFKSDKGAVSTARLMKKVWPHYPPDARERRIQGEVPLKVTIGKDGHVENLKATGGPIELQESAVDAVRQWVYRPFLVMGEPREVEVEVNVIFQLG
jgi:TonB family protein